MTAKQLTPFEEFKGTVNDPKVQRAFGTQLPNDVPLDQFTAVVIRAVQEDPDLLRADRKSLFLACQRAAQDGLIPDKREGALVIYKMQVNDQWVKYVQWQPMISGLRKRLAECGFDIRAEVVCDKDLFDEDKGDEPRITHKINYREDRGAVFCAYAIATNLETGKKYREVMDLDELAKVESMSKAQSGPAYTIWKSQMQRKAVAKRLVNWLPLAGKQHKRLRAMIDRDNEQYDLDTAPTTATDTAKKVQEEIRKPKAITAKKPDLPVVKTAPTVVETTAPPPEPVAVEVEPAQTEPVATEHERTPMQKAEARAMETHEGVPQDEEGDPGF